MTTNFKETGNELFKAGDYKKAISCYLKGVDQPDLKDADRMNYYKNLSMCYLKIEKYKETIEWASKAIEICPGDEKSLYRRSVAHSRLNEWSSAYKDARMLIRLDGKNKLYQGQMASLEARMKAQVDESQSLVGRVSSMAAVLRAGGEDSLLLQSLNNLTALARESADNNVWSQEVRALIAGLCQVERPVAVLEAAQRCLSVLCAGNREKSLDQFKVHGAQYFANMLFSKDGERCRLGGLYLEQLLAGMTQIKAYKEQRDRHERARKENRMGEFSRPFPKYQLEASVAPVVTECLESLLRATNSKRLCAGGRDAVLEMLVRLVPSSGGIGWSKSLLDMEGAVGRLLGAGAAAHCPGRPRDAGISLIEVGPRTKMTVATLLAHVYDDLVSDQDRDRLRDICCDYVMDLFTDEIIESKVEAANLIGLLFQGPQEVGAALLGRSGVLEALLLLARSPEVSHQRAALEAVVLAASKKDKCLSVAAQAVPLLEDIYRTGSDPMKVRALVGMCKLGVAGGRDSSVHSLAEGSTEELARACRRLLASGDQDSARWALEGLAFLTLQAEVKEALVDDPAALAAIFTVAKDENIPLECLYPLCSILVNLTNSYDKPEVLPELVELARYSKQHVPETHEKDAPHHVARRVAVLVSAGLPEALFKATLAVGAAPGPQEGSRELLSRVYGAAAAAEGNRGPLIQAGAGRALLLLAGDEEGNREAGRVLAGQALARLAISRDPRVAFPGQRSLEVVRPLLRLLKVDNTGLQNYEGLLALTNLASIDDAHRRRIVGEKGVSPIEHYMYEEHEELRRAATECVCNLLLLGEVADRYLEEEVCGDRVKMLVLLVVEAVAGGDGRLLLAAGGALAVLSGDPRGLGRVTAVGQWREALLGLLACEDAAARHRGAVLATNLLREGGRDLCQYVTASDLLEVLMAVAAVGGEAGLAAGEALAVIEGHGLIKAAPRAT